MLLRRSRVRALLLALTAALTLTYYLLHSSPTPPPASAPEPVRLAWHMNHQAPSPPFKKSTFDFSLVPRFHPPPSSAPRTLLPAPRPEPLPRIQHDFSLSPPAPASHASRRLEVRALFRRNWQAYRQHAWGADVLLPLSLLPRDQFSGWAATLVDSLSSLYLLGLRPEFDEAVRHVAALDFGTSSTPRVNTFEVNIRYLGGLLSAHDLSGRPVLLRKAVELGDLLLSAFDTATGLPVDSLDFQAAKEGSGLRAEGRVVSASPGTLSLEMTRLSQLTGDPRYFDAVSRVSRLLASGQNDTAMPGLWPLHVSMSRADVVSGREFTLGAGADSLYEYLPKMHLLLEGGDPMYEDMTRGFLGAAPALFYRPMLPPPSGGDETTEGETARARWRDDILISGSVTARAGAPVLNPETEHLTCFLGGTFALAGKLLSSAAALETGARLARGCAYLYRAVPSGIMPERLTLVPCPRSPSSSSQGDDDHPLCAWNATHHAATSASLHHPGRLPTRGPLPRAFAAVADPRYLLRPEAIESLFVMYRLTGDVEYAEMAWDMFVAVRRGTDAGPASAMVGNVLGEGVLEREDYMESFWFAETLKYFYLIFSDPSLVSLDEYVLNTEAHPFRRTRPLA